MKKYKFTGLTREWIKGKTLRQIVAVKDFGSVKKGDVGGFIEKEENLSHDGNCWVTKTALAYGDCKIWGNAIVTGLADISGNACICDDAIIGGQTPIGNNAFICGNAKVSGKADYMFIHGLGTNGSDVTCFRDLDGTIMVKVYPGFFGPLDKLKGYAFEQYGNGQSYKEICALIDLVKMHFGV